jgi:sulfatase modifying factor 1
MNRTFAPLCLYCSILLFASSPATAVTIAWTVVGNAGNAGDPADGDSSTPGIQHYGAVAYAYKIGKYDVTNSQYIEFLNAKDPTGTNTLGLYNSDMSDATLGGIHFTAGNANGGKYSVISGRGNHPANSVTWYDAIRFANWLNNGQGNSDIETGAYTILGGTPTPTNGLSITRNAGATVFLPSEDEWYKAAYYNPVTSSCFLYPTSSNMTPTGTAPTATPNSANCNAVVNQPTNVGAYTGTTSPYGAFDMGGNVNQWNEALIDGSFRGYRGGSFDNVVFGLESSLRANFDPASESSLIGFRVASVPEPSTALLAVLACGLMWWKRQSFRRVA